VRHLARDNPRDQATSTPILPPIDHVSEPVAAAAAETQPDPRRSLHPNLPADWDSYSKKKRDKWFQTQAKANPRPPEPQPELQQGPQQPISPIQKPDDWPKMSPRDKENWLSRYPGGL